MFRLSRSFSSPITLPASRTRGSNANPWQLDAPRPFVFAWMGVAMVAIAMALGYVTVVIGDVFAARPIFLFALPLVIVSAMAFVLSQRALLIVLVLCRAMFDPVFQGASLPGIGGLGGLLNVVVILLAVTLFVLERKKRAPRVAWLPWVAFLAIMALAVARGPDKVFAVRSWLTYFTCAAVYYGAFYCVRSADDLDRLLRWLLLSAIPVAIYAVVSFVINGPAYVVEAGANLSGRLADPLGHPNILGFYFVVVLAAWLIKVKTRPGGPLLTFRTIGWTLHLLMVLGILAGTQSRSAWFGALALFVVYGMFIDRRYLVILVIGAFLAMLIPDVRDRVIELGSNNEVYTYSKLNSYAWRQYLWSSAIAWMSPLTLVIGSGQGSFWFNSISFFPLAGGSNWNAHNVYVQLLFDAGAVGVIAYLLVFAGIGWSLWKSSTLRRDVRVVGLGFVGCFAFMSYSDNMLDYLVVNWNCWFLLGLIAAVGRLDDRDARLAGAPRSP